MSWTRLEKNLDGNAFSVSYGNGISCVLPAVRVSIVFVCVIPISCRTSLVQVKAKSRSRHVLVSLTCRNWPLSNGAECFSREDRVPFRQLTDDHYNATRDFSSDYTISAATVSMRAAAVRALAPESFPIVPTCSDVITCLRVYPDVPRCKVT